MTSHNFWRIRPFVKRIKHQWGMHPTDVIGMLRFEGKRWIDIQKMLDCSQSTIGRYMSEDDKGYQNITPEGREVKRQNAIKLNKRIESGKIR